MHTTISRLRRRTHDESGFTLVELMIVMVVLGLLLAIGVPSYLGFQERARHGLAEGNLRAAVPAVEAFYIDHSSYTLMDEEALRLIDAGVKVTVVYAEGPTYCISSTAGSATYYKNGPGGTISTDPCA